MTTTTSRDAERTWEEDNQRYLLTEVERLRLLLHLRVLWLRTQWKKDPLQNYQGLVISDEVADRLLQSDRAVERARFYDRDPEARAVRQSLAATEAELIRQFEAFEARNLRPAVDVLVHLFRLTPFARDVLLLCLAPHLDPGFDRLYGYVQDDVTRRYPTIHLALSLFAVDEIAVLHARQALLPYMPLRRFRLIQQDGEAGAADALRLTERTRDYLLGVNRIDDDIAEWLRPMPPLLLTPAHETLVERVANEVRSGRSGGAWPLTNIVGRPGSGKRAVARALCETLKLNAFELRPGTLVAAGAERQQAMRLLERESLLSQFAVYVDAAQFEHEPQLKAALLDTIDRLDLFVIVGSRDRVPVNRAALAVPIESPGAAEQQGLWRRALSSGPNVVDGQIAGLVEQFHLGPSMIARVISSAYSRARLADGPDAHVSAELLWQACREESAIPLDALAQRVSACHTWGDIVLPAEVFRQLQEIAAQVAHRSTVYEGWGFGASLGRGRGISALFSGPSGTGKTMAAEILAKELQLDLFRIDLSGVVSKYIGETEKNLRRVFDAAEESGAILFFDEADALFGKRSEVKDSHDRYANIEVNYLLQRMEDYRGLAILATNLKSHLDQAFLRRLRFVVEFPFPDAAHRAQIWQKVFPPAAPLDALDYRVLSHLEIPGGNIKNIAVNAAFLASQGQHPIGMADVFLAARREYAKIERLPMQAEFGAYYELVCA
jgi:hypothetical protein